MSLVKRCWSGPARTFMTSLRSRTQEGGCVDSWRCGAFDRNLKRRIIIYSFLCSVAYDPKGWQKLDRIQNSICKTLLQIFKTFRTASYTTSCTSGCKVYMDLDKWHTSPQEWTLTVCISSACLPNFLNVSKHYTNSLSHLRAKWTKTLFCMDSTSTMQNASYWVACWIITLDVLVVSVKHLSGAVAKNSCREKPAVCLVSIQVVNAAAADAGYCEGGEPSIVSMAKVWVLQHDVQNQLGFLRNNYTTQHVTNKCDKWRDSTRDVH